MYVFVNLVPFIQSNYNNLEKFLQSSPNPRRYLFTGYHFVDGDLHVFVCALWEQLVAITQFL